MPDKIEELLAQATILKEQAAELQEKNRLLWEEAARVKAELATNKAELHDARETISALLAKYNKSQKTTLI